MSAKLPKIKELRALLIDLKSRIQPDYRASEEDTLPSMQVTIGANTNGEWSYQTGDNSYAGGAYSYPHWAVITLYRRSNSTDLARDIQEQLMELMV